MRLAKATLVLLLASSARQAYAWDEAGFCAVAPSPFDAAPMMSSLDDALTCSVPVHAVDGTPLFELPIDAETARGALARALDRAEAREYFEAILELRIVEWYAPTLSDRWALLRGDWLTRAGDAERALEAYGVAAESPVPSVASKARIGKALAGLSLGHAAAEREVDAIVRSHRELGDTAELRYARGRSRLSRRDPQGAADEWRSLDLDAPGSVWAARAREGLAELSEARRANVAPYSRAELAARLDRWIRSGDLAEARAELDRLSREFASDAESATLEPLRARIERLEGGANLPTSAAPSTWPAPSEGSEAEHAALMRRIDAANRRGSRRWRLDDIARSLDLAARSRWTDACDALLRMLHGRSDANGSVLIDAATLAFASASDGVVLATLELLRSDARRATAARYLTARLHELRGRHELAQEAFQDVLANDTSELDWYSMWTRQRLTALRSAPPSPAPPASFDDDEQDSVGEANESGKVLSPRAMNEASRPTIPAATERVDVADFSSAVRKLRSLASRHGTTFPHLARAAVLAELGMNEAASDEVYEVYRLRSEAKPTRRRGAPTVRLDASVKRARLRLDGADLRSLADAAEELGDLGLASRLGNRSATAGHPRAYERTVRDAAARYGVSPALLWAVMRVESRYDRRIVSYAGAVGLMQIMPRTAELIARSLGREDFRTTDLVVPRTSVEFAAWYLRSLIDRFDGSVPLALAAYNGGPHNVRRWLASHPRDVPLDVFLERIPFGQTWHYVRRVMGHYARYKAGEHENVETLSVALPGSLRDTVGF